MVPIGKKRNTKKCKEYRTINLISHAAKAQLRVINKRIYLYMYNKLDGSIEKEQYGFRRGVGTRGAIGLLRVIDERYLERRWRQYVEFVNLEKPFDRVRRDKLLLILEREAPNKKAVL
ncbi:uncharacterized protein LOC142325688 [Lycorma delicatula]|uniref:uncharacterized protein LOC142325688 n=1 Tax=Lycorma delicatula TaxID=130591 RepID=UPI003F51176E